MDILFASKEEKFVKDLQQCMPPNVVLFKIEDDIVHIHGMRYVLLAKDIEHIELKIKKTIPRIPDQSYTSDDIIKLQSLATTLGMFITWPDQPLASDKELRIIYLMELRLIYNDIVDQLLLEDFTKKHPEINPDRIRDFLQKAPRWPSRTHKYAINFLFTKTNGLLKIWEKASPKLKICFHDFAFSIHSSDSPDQKSDAEIGKWLCDKFDTNVQFVDCFWGNHHGLPQNGMYEEDLVIAIDGKLQPHVPFVAKSDESSKKPRENVSSSSTKKPLNPVNPSYNTV